MRFKVRRWKLLVEIHVKPALHATGPVDGPNRICLGMMRAEAEQRLTVWAHKKLFFIGSEDAESLGLNPDLMEAFFAIGAFRAKALWRSFRWNLIAHSAPPLCTFAGRCIWLDPT